MSAGPQVPLALAQQVASALVASLRDGCDRIEVAGSIRRGKATVADVELVVVPRKSPDLFGGPGFDELNTCVVLAVQAGHLHWRDRNGRVTREPPSLADRRYYALVAELPGVQGMPVDLFAVRPPAQWGAIMAIRTGPADYSARLVTTARKRGYKCEEGHLVSLADGTVGETRDTPTEREFIEACGLAYQEPRDRR